MTWPMIPGVAELPLHWSWRVAVVSVELVAALGTLEEMWVPAEQVVEAAGLATARVGPRLKMDFPRSR